MLLLLLVAARKQPDANWSRVPEAGAGIPVAVKGESRGECRARVWWNSVGSGVFVEGNAGECRGEMLVLEKVDCSRLLSDAPAFVNLPRALLTQVDTFLPEASMRFLGASDMPGLTPCSPKLLRAAANERRG